jgi:hypothetical protein
LSAEQRLDRLYSALTAKERGLLVLRAVKAGEKPDRLIYDTTPSGQTTQFNHYIHLINAANAEMAMVLMLLSEQTSKVEMKLAWLQTLQLWADDVGSLRVLVGRNQKEPITESEYARREAEAREELLPLPACVEIIMEDYDWAEADYVTDKDGDRDVSAKAWNRVERETRQRLRGAIGDGSLPSRKRGRAVVVAAGALFNWLGGPTPVYPEEAWEFDVRPDDQAEQVDLDRRAEGVVRRIFERAPKPLPKLADGAPAIEPGERSLTDLEAVLVSSIGELVRQHWCEARAMEIGVAEIAEEFDGEDPLRADTRALLDGCLDSYRKLRDDVADYAEIELAEPSDDDVAQVRRLIEKVAEG